MASLWDNIEITAAAAWDVFQNLNPGSAQFLSGDAPTTAAVAEEQIAAAQGREVDPARVEASSSGGVATIATATAQTGKEIVNKVGDAANKAGGALTSPWLWGGVAVLVVLVVAAPYVVPVLKEATA